MAVLGLDVELGGDGLVVRDELGRRIAQGHALLAGRQLESVADRVEGLVEVAAAKVDAAARGHGRAHLGGHLLHEARDALLLGGRDRHHRHAQLARQQLGVDRHPVGGGLVHHVEGHHHGDVELQQLQAEVEAHLEVAGVDDVDQQLELSAEQALEGLCLLHAVGVERGEARHVEHGDRGTGDARQLRHELAGFDMRGDAGVVAHVGAAAREHVEEGGLARVLGTHDGDVLLLEAAGEFHSASSMLLVMRAAAQEGFAQAAHWAALCSRGSTLISPASALRRVRV